MQQNGLWAEIITYIPLWFIDIGDLRPGGRSGVHIEHAVGLDKQAVQAAACVGHFELGAENGWLTLHQAVGTRVNQYI